MTERGGPTTQAGIDYQNRIAALYFGDLLSFEHEGALRVTGVRVEAPALVDDIVVTHADGTNHWIQAKLALSTGSSEWQRLWLNFKSQIMSESFNGGDRLRLVLGEEPDLAHDLRECAERTTSSPVVEWRSRLTGSHLKLIDSIEAIIGGSAFELFRSLDVERLSNREFDDRVADRLPTSNQQLAGLFAILQSIAAHRSRRRQRYSAPSLRSLLRSEYSVELSPPAHWGLAAYLKTIVLANIAVPGTSVGGRVGSSFHWPRALKSQDTEADFEDENTFERPERTSAEFDLQLFPTADTRKCIVHAGPGFGKSSLLLAIANRTAESAEYIPAIISLSDLSASQLDILSYLNSSHNQAYSVALDWTRLCETGMAMVLFDGLDEVPITERSTVVDRLERFTRRFNEVPWMMSVRDTSVLPAGFDAEKIELCPLSDADMRDYAEVLQPSLSKQEAERLIARVTAYPELQRLVRIPLFLALLIATWKPGDPVPRRRTDLIEAYLKTLFRPEEHKNAERCADPELLRSAMQNLAHKLLLNGEVGTQERDVRKLLAEHATASVSAERLYDDALRCGILKRPATGRLSFPFPIVQEYLAGQELLETHPDSIPLRAMQAVQRPWAQAVQFALEKVAHGDQIGWMLLNAPDDVFLTSTRLLARCIVNGMKCSNELHVAVGERLANAWHRQSFWTARRVGQLIDDGWSSPPGAAVRAALHRRDLLHDGAGDIIARLHDDDLTLSVLRKYLERPKHVAHVGSLQSAVDRIASQALALYLQVVQSGAFGDDVWAAAALIGRLDRGRISPGQLSKAIDDTSLPSSVRLSLIGLAGGQPTSLYWELAHEALSQERASNHWAAIKALRWMDKPETYVLALLRNQNLHLEAHRSIVGHIRDVLPDIQQQKEFFTDHSADLTLSADTRVRLRVSASGLGVGAAFESLIEEFETLNVSDASSFLICINEFPNKAMGDRAVAAMRSRKSSPEEKLQLANSFLIGATHRLEGWSYDGGALLDAPKHPSLGGFLSLLEEWHAETTDDDLSTALAMTTLAARHGIPDTIERLRSLASRVISQHSTEGYANPFNSSIRSALEVLERQRSCVNLELAIQLSESTDSNAEIGALVHIGAIGSREALDYLLKRSRQNRDNHATIFAAIENISGRLGLKVVEDGLGYRVDAVDMAQA